VLRSFNFLKNVHISNGQILWPGLIICLLILSGCKSPSIADRRKMYSNEYVGLSDEEKALVDRGVLRKGMSTNAVLIIWGKPTIIGSISTPNGPFVTWEYYRKRSAPELATHTEAIVPWSSTPIPANQVLPGTPLNSSPPVIEWLDRTAVFHGDRLVNWSPMKF